MKATKCITKARKQGKVLSYESDTIKAAVNERLDVKIAAMTVTGKDFLLHGIYL